MPGRVLNTILPKIKVKFKKNFEFMITRFNQIIINQIIIIQTIFITEIKTNIQINYSDKYPGPDLLQGGDFCTK